MRDSNTAIAVVLAALLAVPILAGGAAAAPPADRVLPPEQHTSEKGRGLAQKYMADLQALNADIYNCMPWVDVQKTGIGFYRPKQLTGDPRYLSLNVVIDQKPSAEFSSYAREERASRMFSRYVPVFLAKMTHDHAVLEDPQVDGFTIILSWLKAEPTSPSERPVNETIAVFIAKAVARGYLAHQLPVGQLADAATVLGWDGKSPVGPVKVTAWEDNFLSTFKIANYQPDAGATCP